MCKRPDKERYDVFNLPGVENANLTGDIQRCNRPDLQRRYDGVISLNCLYMMQNPEAAINNMMKLVRNDGIAVLDFPCPHYWYIAEDGCHRQTFNPLQIHSLIDPYLYDYLLIPMGNLSQAAIDYYSRKKKLKKIRSFLHAICDLLGPLDRNSKSALHYIMVGKKKRT